MAKMASARQLVGRRIVRVEPGRFSDGRGGVAHAPLLVLDNGAVLRFEVEETDVNCYGVTLVLHPAKKNDDR